MIDASDSNVKKASFLTASLIVLASAALALSLGLVTMGYFQAADAQVAHGMGATKQCVDSNKNLGDTMDCTGFSTFSDPDAVRILEALDAQGTPGSNPFIFHNGVSLQVTNLGTGSVVPISPSNVFASKNGICAAGNTAFPCLLAPSGDEYFDPVTGLTTPGAAGDGFITVAFGGYTYTTNGAHPDQWGYAWQDTCSNSISGCNASSTNVSTAPAEVIIPRADVNVSTLSNPVGPIAPPVTNPSDTVTVVGVAGITPTGTAIFTLNGPSGLVVQSQPQPLAQSVPGTATATFTHLDSLIQTGQYCWDVIVDVNDPYNDPAPHIGLQHVATECFNIQEVPFTVTTLSNPVSPPSLDVGSTALDNPTDKVFIQGLDGLAGTFTVSNHLWFKGPSDASFNIYATAVDIKCATPVSSVGPAHTYSIDSDCVITNASLLPIKAPGLYCWDAFVNETTGSYTPSQVQHDGRLADNQSTECFTVNPVPYQVRTQADPVGAQSGAVTDPSDTVYIQGVDGVPGEFTVSAVLWKPDATSVAATCATPVSSVGPAHTYSIDSDCDVLDTFTAPGLYCWDVTVNETTGNYSPSQVQHDGRLADNQSTECFTIPTTGEGLTPGFWGSNWYLWNPTVEGDTRPIAGGKFQVSPQGPVQDLYSSAWDTCGFDTTSKFATVFGVTNANVLNSKVSGSYKDVYTGKQVVFRNVEVKDLSLLQAINSNGNTNSQALMRHAVAAILNACNPFVDYPYALQDIKDAVGSALNNSPSGTSVSGNAALNGLSINDLKNVLAGANELGNGINVFGYE